MKGAIWKLTARFTVPFTVSVSNTETAKNSCKCAHNVALGLCFASSSSVSVDGLVAVSERCSAAAVRLMLEPQRWWSSFWKTGCHGVVRSSSSSAFRRASIAQYPALCFESRARSWQLPSCFEIRKLDSRNMSGEQRRVRKEKVMAVETVVQVRGVRNGVGSKSTSEEGVRKLSKDDCEVDSWLFQLLERHESNDLNSYTVAELRPLLRKMEKQPKGQKADLIKAVQSWLYEHGYPSPPAVEESSRDPDESSRDIGTPEEVAIISKTRAAVSERVETQGGKKRAGSESSLPSSRKRRKDAEYDETDVVNVTAHVEKANKKSLKGKSSKKDTVKGAVVKGGIVAEGHKEPWTVLVHKRPPLEWLAYDPKTMRPKPLANDEKAVRLVSWNVNGLRALLKEKGVQHEQGSLIARLAVTEDFDVLCLQETKLQEKDVEDIRKSLLASHEESLWSCSTSKLGYSGTAIISRIKPLSVHYGLGVSEHDKEGRLITCEFDSFYFVVSYVPNSGAKLERLAYRTQEWDTALSRYLKELEKKKPVILTGDLNCAYEDIDIHDPANNKRSAGFTDEERESFRKNFLDHGFVDTFRMQHPNAVAYTYWGYRTAARPKNRGWRLDYFLVSESLSKNVHDSYTIPDVGGSDHCPIGLILKT